MLKQRVITALWLLPLMLGMLFYAPAWLWAAFSGLIALLALWEYARMAGLDKRQTNHYLASSAVFGVIAYAGNWQLPALVWYAVLVFWLVGMPLWLKNKWKLGGGWQVYATGWLMMMPFWFALNALRAADAGVVPLLAVMGLVWVADIGAYFSGKAFGKHKLAPAISPGKSCEGAVGAVLCVAVYLTVLRSLGYLPFSAGWLGTVSFGLLLTVLSIGGDLLESWLKRAADMKDSSNLLPGHGGVFDRVDSLIAVVSVYAACRFLF